MYQHDWYTIYVKHAKADFRVKKGIVKDEIYAGMTKQELKKVGVTKQDIVKATSKNWIKAHYFKKPGVKTALTAYLFVGEESRQWGLKIFLYSLFRFFTGKTPKEFD